MNTARCTFCNQQIAFGMIGERLKITHRLPHCQRFTSLSPRDFLKQSAYQICADKIKQFRLAVN
jgi:hypothetical protein